MRQCGPSSRIGFPAFLGWRVEFKEPKRSDEQNDRMWELLGAYLGASPLLGKKYSPEDWKCVFMKQMGKEARFLPTLDETGFFPTVQVI